jgi:hypothetical protein
VGSSPASPHPALPPYLEQQAGRQQRRAAVPEQRGSRVDLPAEDADRAGVAAAAARRRRQVAQQQVEQHGAGKVEGVARRFQRPQQEVGPAVGCDDGAQQGGLAAELALRHGPLASPRLLLRVAQRNWLNVAQRKNTLQGQALVLQRKLATCSSHSCRRPSNPPSASTATAGARRSQAAARVAGQTCPPGSAATGRCRAAAASQPS